MITITTFTSQINASGEYVYKFDDKNVCLMPLTNYNLENNINCDNEFLTESMLLSCFSESFLKSFPFQNLDCGEDGALEYSPILLESEYGKFSMYLPSNNKIIDEPGSNYDYLIFIEDLKFIHDENTSRFLAKFKFAIWDIQTSKPVKFGQTATAVKTTKEIDRATVKKIIKKITNKIAAKENYPHKKDSYSEVSIRISHSFNSHLRKTKENDINKFGQSSEFPSLGHFVTETLAFEPEVLLHHYFQQHRLGLGIGYNYESCEPGNDSRSIFYINNTAPLEQTITINTLMLSFSYGYAIDQFQNTYLYFKTSLIHRNYSGELKFPGALKATLNMSNSDHLGIALGLDHTFPYSILGITPKSIFGFFVEVGYEFAETSLDGVDTYKFSGNFNRLELSDNRVKVRAGFSFNF